MSWAELLAAAGIQGLTEFLPVSSSGHLLLVHRLWGIAEPTLFVDVLLHLGTTAAVLLAFRRTIVAWLTRERRSVGLVVLATIPTVLVGLWLHHAVEAETAGHGMRQIGVEFLVTAVWIAVAHWQGRYQARTGTGAPVIQWWQAIVIGTAQGIAAIPAISRSAATISTSLILGVSPAAAVEFSLLISVPAILGAALYETAKAGWSLPHQLSSAQVVAAFATTFLIGWITIWLLERLTVRRRLLPFAVYCGALGLWLVCGGLS